MRPKQPLTFQMCRVPPLVDSFPVVLLYLPVTVPPVVALVPATSAVQPEPESVAKMPVILPVVVGDLYLLAVRG